MEPMVSLARHFARPAHLRNLSVGNAAAVAAAASRPVPSDSAIKGADSAGIAGPSTAGRRSAPAAKHLIVASPKFTVDYATSFKSRSTLEIARAYTLLCAGGIPLVVKHAKTLLDGGRRLVGDKLVDFALKHTFAAQFTGGEDLDDLRPNVAKMNKHGIGAILDYCAEADMDHGQGGASDDLDHPALPAMPELDTFPASQIQQYTVNPNMMDRRQGWPTARTYFFEDSATCDANMEICRTAITTAAAQTVAPFAAIKITALLEPKAMVSAARVIMALRHAYPSGCDLKQHHSCINLANFRETGINFDNLAKMTRAEFNRQMQTAFPELTAMDMKHIESVTTWRTEADLGHVDYIDWIQVVDQIWHNSALVSRLGIEPAPEEEAHSIMVGLERASELAIVARDNGVRMMIDAEQSYFQPAIDMMVRTMQVKFNTQHTATVWNTFQCYLKNTYLRVHIDQIMLERRKKMFGCKFVRGAYIVQERQRAEDMGYSDPICPTMQDTHDNYDRCVLRMLPKIKAGQAEYMLATHNQQSIELAVNQLQQMDMGPDSPIFFGQLLGMGDHITASLAADGYSCYKYVPYGPVKESVAYLIRRLEENSTMLAGEPVLRERRMLFDEVRRRVQYSLGL